MTRSSTRRAGRRLRAALGARPLYHLDRLRPPGSDRWDEVVGDLLTGGVDVVGFDVYDTLLSREVNLPTAIDAAVAAEIVDLGLWDGDAASYLDARRSAAGRRPGENLAEWYRHPELADRADTAACLRAELALEEQITGPVPGAADALDQLRACGLEIGFLSDMHLPADFIARLLAGAELRRPGELLLVSGDVGRWKSDGGLFDHWYEATGRPPSRAAYVGNHAFVDRAVPRSKGTLAVQRQSGNALAEERRLADSGVAGAVVAAASTRARLATAERLGPTTAAVGAAVLGQTLVSFLLAARDRCLQAGIRQVAFVARDADLPFRLAGAMPKDHWSSIDLHYIHGNRITWTLAGAHTSGVDTWLAVGCHDEQSFLRQGLEQLSPAELLGRIGLTADEVARPLLEALGSVGPGERLAPWIELLADDRVRATIEAKAAARAGLVGDYLRTQGLREERTLILDIGWRGQSAAMVSGLVERVLGVEPLNFHFGGYGVRADIDALCPIERYAFDDGRAPAPFHGVDQCLEMFTGAGQPRAVDYRRLGGDRVEPVFDDGRPDLGRGLREDLWSVALSMAELLPSGERFDRWADGPPDPDAVVDVLRRFWTRPTTEEAAMATQLAIETDERGRSIVPVATPYTLGELRHRSPRRWRQGSLAASSRLVRAAGVARREH